MLFTSSQATATYKTFIDTNILFFSFRAPGGKRARLVRLLTILSDSLIIMIYLDSTFSSGDSIEKNKARHEGFFSVTPARFLIHLKAIINRTWILQLAELNAAFTVMLNNMN